MNILKQTPPVKGEFSPSLPEPTELKLRPFYDAYVQASYEAYLLKFVPEMGNQRRNMERQAKILLKKYLVVEAGFEPFHPNNQWYTGYLSQPHRENSKTRLAVNYNLYKHPIPLPVLGKYIEAKKSGLFTQFSVHSPSSEVFHNIRLIIQDPVLVGWMEDSWVDWNGQIEGTKTGFLIGAWDLAKDLKYNTAQLPERASS